MGELTIIGRFIHTSEPDGCVVSSPCAGLGQTSYLSFICTFDLRQREFSSQIWTFSFDG